MTSTPAPLGAYSQTRRIGGLLQVSGQLGIDPNTGQISGDIRQQTARCLAAVHALLQAEGADWRNVLSVRIHLADDVLFDDFDREYAAHIPSPAPARTTTSAGLAPGALIEIDALAVLS